MVSPPELRYAAFPAVLRRDRATVLICRSGAGTRASGKAIHGVNGLPEQPNASSGCELSIPVRLAVECAGAGNGHARGPLRRESDSARVTGHDGVYCAGVNSMILQEVRRAAIWMMDSLNRAAS